MIRKLAKEGVAIVYISHRMEEVVALADTVTVLRDGQLIGSMSQEKASRREIIRMMVGRELQEVFASGKSETATRKPVLEVQNLRLENPAPTVARSMLVQNVSFSVVAGEVFGIAGLLGAGRTETLEVLFGLHPGTSGGEVRIEGQKIRLLNPVDAKAAGIALVTEDRKRDGLVLGAGIDRNAELAVLRTIAAFGLVSTNEEQNLAERTIRDLGHSGQRTSTTGWNPERRQPAKTSDREMAADQAESLAVGRTDARNRCRGQGGNLSFD